MTTFKSILIGKGLFVLALLIRLPYLNDFMTIDEVKWIEGAGQFLLGLYSGNFSATYWHFFPGITITWGETIILWLQYLASDSSNLEIFLNSSDIQRSWKEAR